MTTKVTGDVILDKIIQQLAKEFSKDDLIDTAPRVKSIAATTSGSLALDVGMGVGGFPLGRCVEIFGLESSGKTSLALSGAAQYQKQYPDRYVLVTDVEYTMTQDFVTGFGINPKKVLFVQPDNANEAIQSTLNLVKSGQIGFLVFDSIDALVTERALKKNVFDNDVGGTSKIMARFFREYHKVASDAECTSIFINQLKYNPGVMFGSTETTPGGTAARFYSSVRLKCSPAKPATTPGAFKMKVKVVKNKVAPPIARFIEFDFLYGKGPEPITDHLNAGKDLGILAFQGPSLKMIVDGVTKPLSTGGIEGFAEHCRAHPEILVQIRDLALELARKQSIADVDISEDTDDS